MAKQLATTNETRTHKHRQAAAKLVACAKPLILSTLGRKEKKKGG